MIGIVQCLYHLCELSKTLQCICDLLSTHKDKLRVGGYPAPKPSFNLAAVVAETIGLSVEEESVSIPKFLT